ncbi:MAG: amino acid permease, partial [Planctomycetota bacterium]
VPFYILGFTEALCRSYEPLSPHFQRIALLTAAVFFTISYVGAKWAIKTQYVIMAVLFLAIVAFLAGAVSHFSLARFFANWAPLAAAQASSGGEALKEFPLLGFWAVFAIYFPAATGIDAGVNMSGDLKDPGRSIPRGVLSAVGLGFFIYLLEILLCGGAYAREDLIRTPFQLLRDHAILGAGFLVTLGVFAATLSSALGSYLASPRVLQAVSRDPVLGFLRPLGKGSARGDEPRRALLAVGAITFLVLLWAGNKSEGGALNIVAAIVTMFFLYTYGMMNLAAFIEAIGHNPSFRPRFRYFHWATALLGAVGCVAVSFLISAFSALLAVVVIALLYWYVRARQLSKTFGDARRGFVYASARRNLLQLSEMAEDSRNWRPTILVFSGSPASRETLVRYAVWLESGRGVVILANILLAPLEEGMRLRAAGIRQLEEFCREKDLQAFPLVVASETLDQGMALLLQAAGLGPIRPNLAAFGWPSDEERGQVLLQHLRLASSIGMSLLLLCDRGLPSSGGRKRIDLWWRGRKNGSIMVILAYLLAGNWEWDRSRIRVLRVVENEEGRAPALEALEALIRKTRVEAEVEVLVSESPFPEILRRHSGDADCVILGFELPAKEEEAAWRERWNACLAGLPTALLVRSIGGAGMLA